MNTQKISVEIEALNQLLRWSGDNLLGKHHIELLNFVQSLIANSQQAPETKESGDGNDG